MATRKNDPVNVEYETRAKNLLKGELKRKGVTYAQLAEMLATIGVHETERNLNNKISRGGFLLRSYFNVFLFSILMLSVFRSSKYASRDFLVT